MSTVSAMALKLSSALDQSVELLGRATEAWRPFELEKAYEKVRAQRARPVSDPRNADRFAAALEKLLTKGVAALGNFDHMLLAYNLAQEHALLGDAALLTRGRILSPLLSAWHPLVKNGGGMFIWRGALLSYFRAPAKSAEFFELREFLADTLESISARKHAPDWLHAAVKHCTLLADEPALAYAQSWVGGDNASVTKLKAELELPDSSWFWKDFAHAVVEVCCATPDDALFEQRKCAALDLTRHFAEQSAYVLVNVLNRNARSKSSPRDDRLLALVLDAWGSPQLGFSGNKHKWSDASPKAVEMVCSWLAEEDLEDFRLYCEGDESVDDRRLAYWLRFKEQITFSKLILGRTIWNARDKRTREFIARKRGRVAELSSPRNALVLRIGSWWFVEFSEKGKACCPYREGCGYDFDFSLQTFSEGALRSTHAIEASGGRRLIHRGDWEADFDSFLASKRIWPDSVVMARRERLKEKQAAQRDTKCAQLKYVPPQSARTVRAIVASLELDQDVASHLTLISREVIDNRERGGRLWIELKGVPSDRLQDAMRNRNFQFARGRGFYWIES